MTTPTDLHDPDLEARLRTTLRARAHSVTGPPPPLGRPASVVVLDRSRRSHAVSRRLLLAGAAACLLIGTAVAVPRLADDGKRGLRSGAPTVETPAPPVPPALPEGVDLQASPPIFTADGDAEAVATAYLVDRLSDGNSEVRNQLTGEITLAAEASLGQIIAVHWTQADPRALDGDQLPSGRVFLRQDDTWSVVASLTDGVSLSGVVREGRLVSGQVDTDRSHSNLGEPAIDLVPLTATGGTMPTDGTGTGEVPRYGLVALGLDPFEADAGTAPVVQSVRKPGGRTLGISEVVLPGPPPSLATPEDLAGPDLPGLWPGPADHAPTLTGRARRRDLDAPRFTPEETIFSFLVRLLGEAPVRITSIQEETGLAGQPYQVVTTGGHTSTVYVAPDTSAAGWFVVQVDDPGPLDCAVGGFGDPPAQDAQRATYSCPPPADATSGTLSYSDGTETRTVDVTAEAAEGPMELGIAPSDVRAVVVVYRDAEGRVVAMQGS